MVSDLFILTFVYSRRQNEQQIGSKKSKPNDGCTISLLTAVGRSYCRFSPITSKPTEKAKKNHSKSIPTLYKRSKYLDGWKRSSSKDDKNSSIMYTFPNISKPRFGKDRSATPSQPKKVALAITLERFDNLSVPKTFATEDEVGGYVSMEMPESTAFDSVSITLEGSHPTSLCHHLNL